MEDIKKLWDETNMQYNDMLQRLVYVENKNKSLLNTKPINDKMTLLTTDLKEVISTMEKICIYIDDIHADQGTITTKLNDDKNINFKKLLKIMTSIQSN